MPPELIRLTFHRRQPGSHIIVEYGEEKTRGLTPEEKVEYDKLGEELLDKQDAFLEFQAADLTPEKKELLAKKQRFEAFEKLAKETTICWNIVDPRQIDSVLLVIQGFDELPVYVENLPSTMIERLLSANLNIGTASIFLGGEQAAYLETVGSHPLPRNNLAAKLAEIRGMLDQALPEWEKHIDVMPVGDVIHVRPKKFMGDLWAPVNEAMRAKYGEKCWVSKGKGSKDRTAHWEVSLK